MFKKMQTCFVIQPFDGGKFDKRFGDVFKPAIEEADLEAYRVDHDPSVTVPIEEIEKGIRDAAVCLADISLDNPNVWFELGFAIASNKPVILVCSEERTKFPFDVQHRTIIRYVTDSPRDFVALKQQITSRIKAVLKKEAALEAIALNGPLANAVGLSPYELVVLAVIAGSIYSPGDHIAARFVRQDVERSGFTPLAVTLGLRKLEAKGFVNSADYMEVDSETYIGYSVTNRGWDWITSNEGEFSMRKKSKDGDDFPF